MSARRSAVALLVLGGAICGASCDTGPATGAPTVRDSAGVAILTHAGPEPLATVWNVTEDLRIGRLDGPDSVTFGMVADLAVDAQGSIYVLDQQSQRVKVYDAAGAFVRFLGGPGRGPGELSQWATDVLVRPDGSVLVPDYAQSRLSVYGPDGALRETLAIPRRPHGISWRAAGEGILLFRGITLSPDETGAWRSWDALLRFDRAAPDRTDTLLIFDYPVTSLGTRQDLKVPLIVNSPFWDLLPDGRIAWGSLDRPEVRVHAPDGHLTQIIRRTAWTPRAASAADQDGLRQLLRDKLQAIGGSSAPADGPNVVLPDSLPAITGVRAGPDGGLWVQRMGAVEDADPAGVNAPGPAEALGGGTWDVFAADGMLRGEVRLPRRFRLLEITPGAVYGVLRDENDVEFVARLRLTS